MFFLIRSTALAAALLTVQSCSQQQAAPAAVTPAKPDPIKVRTTSAETRAFERVIPATGSLYPDETVTISSETLGRVESVHADYGQTVRKGSVIAEIDKSGLRLQLQRSRAMLTQALARVGLASEEENMKPEDTPAIRQARAQYEDALSKFESGKKLFASGDISRERYSELEKTLLSRRAALDGAGYELQTQMANIAALKAEMRLVEKRIEDSTIRAPFDGTVQERMVAPGQYVKDNTPIVRLVKTWPLRLRLDVPEPAAAYVRPGTQVRFQTEAVPGAEFQAVVTQLNPALDMRSRSLNAEARISGADARLKPGMFVQVEIMAGRSESVAVPEKAIQTVAGLRKVFVVRERKAKELRIVPGASSEGWVEVDDGNLKAGDQVALDQLARLTDGAEVEVVR